MSHARLSAALATVAICGLILPLAGASSARAEFFGCNDRPGQVLYDSNWSHGGARTSRSARYTHEYSAQPRRTTAARVTTSGARRYYSDSRYR